ncbi:MAG: GrpB family protein [Gemmatimonadaceae bacterium]
MPSRYTFAEYSLEWAAEFSKEAERLRALLGDDLVTVHHIGSTSVPGLAAKPTIDLLPLVRDIARVDDRTPMLQEAGYTAWGEYGLERRRYFTKDHAEYRTHNIHMYQVDDPSVERHLAFCAYLRNHAKVRTAYEVLKRAVYALHPADIEAYSDGKDSWIKAVEPSAIAWFRQQAHQRPAPTAASSR